MEIQWPLVLFTVVAGAGSWLFAWSTIGTLAKKSALPTKKESIVAFILLVIGGCLSVLHLKHVDRILEALNRPTSGIFVEAALIGVMCAIVAIFFILVVRKSSPKAQQVVAIIGAIVGIIFPFMCGESYLMEARPAWMSLFLPLAYCATCAAAGAALNLVCKLFEGADTEAVKFSGVLALVGGILAAIFSIAYCVFAATKVSLADAGSIAWIAVLVICIVVCIAGGAFVAKTSYAQNQKDVEGETAEAASKLKGLAIVLLVAGILCAIALRVVMWLAGTPSIDFFLMPLD
jgi:anaerobic dimethyl sulfoxide reductase subunit C (anchor subunit)